MELYCPRLPKVITLTQGVAGTVAIICLLYTSDAADEL